MTLAPLPAALGVRDIRSLLYKPEWNWKTRPGRPKYITLHWNGPEVNNSTYATELRQLQGDARWHTRPGAFAVAEGGDGVMYHFAVTAQGFTLALRNIEAVLWHCGNSEGNLWSVSVQLPLGKRKNGTEQQATTAQWAATVALCDALIDLYVMPGGRQAVRGHMEWKRTDCPGQSMMTKIRAYRAGEHAEVAQITYWQAKERISWDANDNFMAVRQAPRADAPAAVDRNGNPIRIQPNEQIEVGAIVADERKPASKVWLWLANGAGFTHISGYNAR